MASERLNDGQSGAGEPGFDSRLVVVSGPAKGTLVRLASDGISVGRESANELCLRGDQAVSRRHFRISRTDSAFQLIDLNSHNGTFVNGIPVRRKLLNHGDTIRLGRCELVFLITDEEVENLEALAFREAEPADLLTTTNVRAYPSAVRESGDVGRMARDLNALFKIASSINSIRDLNSLQEHLLQFVAEVVPAESGAVVVLRHADEEPISSRVWHRRKGDDTQIRIRRELVQRALWERSPIFSKPAATSPEREFVICVPLVGTERTLGVLYMIATDPAAFQDDHVHFLNSAAAIAGVSLENVMATEALRNENRRLQAEIDLDGVIIGESKGMRQVQNFIGRVANTDSTVLIRGESGTGKELVARAIHRNSERAEKPFVAINCAAIPEALLESELFGHEKGSFTGAIAMKKGKLELAGSGTVFLDEIGDMAPLLQVKLLRALQEREFERVGGTRTIKLEARVIAATNKNLEEAMKEGEFRQDLYYRLNVVSVVVPPLRERPDDIPLLAMYFAAKYSERCKRPLKGMSSAVRSLLTHYSWPGNVRELENAIEHAIVMGTGDEIVPEDLPEALLELEPPENEGKTYHDKINQLKKQVIIDAVRQAKGNYTEAARAIGVHPNYLHRLIRNLNIKDELRKE